MLGPDSRPRSSIRTETPFAEYANRPIEFFKDVMGVECWGSPQETVAHLLAERDRVSVKTGHGVGKTWLGAHICLWFDQTRPFSKVITTAPKWEQVETRQWPEIRKAWALSRTPLIGRCLTTDVHVAPNWFVHGENTDDPIKFQGVHAIGGVLLWVDEAAGFLEALYQAASGFMTQGGCKTFLTGNPNLRHGKFFRSFGDPGWANHTISSEAAPEHIVSRAWIDEMRRDCGPVPERHPVYQIRVMGEFADADEAGLFPLSVLERSALSVPTHGGRHIGADIARFGGDKCVALLLVDGRVSGLYAWEKTDLMRSARILYRLLDKWRVDPRSGNLHVDVCGLGAGVVDRLREMGVEVDGVDFGEGVTNTEADGTKRHMRGDWEEYVGDKIKFFNLRSELHWSARRLLDEGQLVVSENYRELWVDLQGIPYAFTPDDKLKIMPKDKIRALLGRSPDYSDALMVALSRPRRVQPRVTVVTNRRRARSRR